jgi:WbqC-like protein family
LTAKPTKTVAIVQSSYIPWKGYFDLINLADEFILYDDRQYTRRDWRNRNRIKTPQGTRWLTIPVEAKGKYLQPICETRVADQRWPRRHWEALVHNYTAGPHFAAYRDLVEELYLGCREEHLSLVNRRFLDALCDVLGITTAITWSMDYEAEGAKTERLVSLCRCAGASEYVSGPTAKAYLDESLFAQAGMRLTYMDYSGYPEYPQLHPPFEHAVSIVDLLFNTGDRAREYMQRFSASRVRT